MSLYTISDLHLPLGVNKPMDIFGPVWQNYVPRLRENWLAVVREADTVVLPGDFSWAMRLEETAADFDFLTALPGVKILLKGNHDYWWSSAAKLQEYMTLRGYAGIYFMHNNAFFYQETALCGTRFWPCPGSAGFDSAEDAKLYARELCRLELSLKEAAKRSPKRTIVFTHYPPATGEKGPDPAFAALMKAYEVTQVIFGHLHGAGTENAVTGEFDGTTYHLASCDYLGFTPLRLLD